MEPKIIWITGASSGLGEALSLNYSKPGVTLILSALEDEKVKIVAEKCMARGAEVFYMGFNISIKEEVDKAVKTIFEKYTYIDLLINNAGIGQRSLAIDTSNDVEQRIMNTNYWSVIWLTKAVLPRMINRAQGHIAVVSSISGLFSFPMRSSYAASKHALMGYFESLSVELAHTPIKTTLICPGRMNNDFSIEALTAKGEKYGKMDKSHTTGVPLEVASEKIVKAIQNQKRYLVFGKKEVLLWYAKRISPKLFFKIASSLPMNK